MRKEFDEFIYNLIELLNNTFNKEGGWFLSDNEFNRLGATIEHENGVKFDLYDEEVNNNSDVTLIVIYPNRKSKWLGDLWQKDITDIADKMYEYAVVKRRRFESRSRKFEDKQTMRELKRNKKFEINSSSISQKNQRVESGMKQDLLEELKSFRKQVAIIEGQANILCNKLEKRKDSLDSDLIDELRYFSSCSEGLFDRLAERILSEDSNLD